MKRFRVVLIGVLALGLAGSVTAAADASGIYPRSDALPTVAGCPSPGAKAEKVEVKDGKIFHNGKEVGSVSATDEPLVVAMKDGKFYSGKDAEALPAPDGAQFGTGPLSQHAGDGKGHVMICASEPATKE
jgi:hypothetical protein